MGMMDEPIEDGIAEGGVADNVMPVIDRELTGDEGGTSAVAVLEHFEEISAFGLVEGLEPEVIDQQRGGFLEAVE